MKPQWDEKGWKLKQFNLLVIRIYSQHTYLHEIVLGNTILFFSVFGI